MQTETDRLLQGFALASTHLMTIPDGQATVQAGLGALGSALEVDRVYIFEHHPHPQTGEWAASQRWEWVNEGVTPQIDHPALQNCPFADFFPRWFPILTQGQPIGGLIKDFPDNEQAILAPQGILSMLVVPIFIQDRCWGFVGFDDCHHERVWESSIQAALKSFAGTLGSAIARWKAEANAKELAARLQAAQRIAHIGNWELNLQDNALYWSEEVFRIFEVDPQQFGASYEAFLGLVHPEDRPLVEAAYGKHVSDRQPYELVYRLQCPMAGLSMFGSSAKPPMMLEAHPCFPRVRCRILPNRRKPNCAANAPKPVATPLPPRNPIHGESVCPTIAPAAVASQHHDVSAGDAPGPAPSVPSRLPAASTGRAPLVASSRKQAMPQGRPSVRPRFVAP